MKNHGKINEKIKTQGRASKIFLLRWSLDFFAQISVRRLTESPYPVSRPNGSLQLEISQAVCGFLFFL